MAAAQRLMLLRGLRPGVCPGVCPGAALIHTTVPNYKVNNKHYDRKWRELRARKVIKVELPDFEEQEMVRKGELSQEEIRSRLKEKGVVPPRPWIERPINISCTGAVFEPYVPPEGDGKMSAVSLSGTKQTVEFVEKKGKSMMAVRKIRSFDEDFSPKYFTADAQQIYLDSHEALVKKDKHKLRTLVTEKAYPEMMDNVRRHTIHWQFVKSMEPPRVVHMRCTDVISKDNIYGQITVRFHTQQILAIYDRFGRLCHGSEVVAKDVLEYVVFEKHLSNQYGVWRIHAKIIPDWMPPREPLPRTGPVIAEAEASQEEVKQPAVQ